jgi:signal transduction histidine kinase
LYAFFDPIEASRLSDFFWLVGPPVFCASLLGAAVREPSSLRSFAAKVALCVLLITCAVMVLTSKQVGGIWVSPDTELTPELFMRTLLFVSIQPFVIMAMASWIFDRLQAKHLQNISGELQTSQDSLELETKRLERQRKFTAMLAHELKNPLAVSYMALSGIESRLASDAPLLERAASIKQSLQEIDAIIDRCTEMDGYEQGQLPMSLGSFTLTHLMSTLKVANPSERICILVRGIHDDALLISDIQYIKIILSNLLTNALKYSPADSMVELIVQSVIRDGETRAVEFSVSNEVGEAGTPSAELAFERFYRTEAARKQSGAGLGLWLSQALAHALGSQVVMQTKGDKISFSLTFSYV